MWEPQLHPWNKEATSLQYCQEDKIDNECQAPGTKAGKQ